MIAFVLRLSNSLENYGFFFSSFTFQYTASDFLFYFLFYIISLESAHNFVSGGGGMVLN